MKHSQQNLKAMDDLERQYPKSKWSMSFWEEEDEITVTFQRYRDDAEDRYVIRDGEAKLI